MDTGVPAPCEPWSGLVEVVEPDPVDTDCVPSTMRRSRALMIRCSVEMADLTESGRYGARSFCHSAASLSDPTGSCDDSPPSCMLAWTVFSVRASELTMALISRTTPFSSCLVMRGAAVDSNNLGSMVSMPGAMPVFARLIDSSSRCVDYLYHTDRPAALAIVNIHPVGAAWLPLGLHAVDRWVRLGRLSGLVELATVLSMQVQGGEGAGSLLAGAAESRLCPARGSISHCTVGFTHRRGPPATGGGGQSPL